MQITINQVTVTNWSQNPLMGLSDDKKTKLSLAIDYSRQIVDDSLQLLRGYLRHQVCRSVDSKMAADLFSQGDNAVVDEALPKYFGLDMKSPTLNTELQTIIAKFEQTRRGICGPFELVVGDIHDADDIVTGVSRSANLLKHGHGIKAIERLKGIRTMTEGWVGYHSNNTTGRIHLNSSSLRNEPAGKVARIIVHEATHKFADTDDIAYKWDRLRYNQGGHAGLINNADSYAWAGRLMWKRRRRLASGI